MTKRHFIALADAIRNHNNHAQVAGFDGFDEHQLATLAAFCLRQNPHFNRARWIGYIEGTNGQNGGKP
jgi:hypothetical protein